MDISASRADRLVMNARALVVVMTLALTAGACGSGKVPPKPQPFPQPASAPAAIQPPSRSPVPPTSTAPAASKAASNPTPSGMPLSESVLDSARAQLGVKYQIGGDQPSTGFDCSGFVRYVFGAHQVELPRTVAGQFGRGIKIAIQDVRAGDLVFFSTTGPGPTHVGIALGNGEFIHAPSSTGVVRVEHYDTPYWHDRLVGARRVF